MSEMLEIRWHGRGGQGAKTAALLLADVAFNIGKQVQGFPEYGPERMGAPITAYNRISDQEIRVHSNIYEPDYVVVVDETLLHTVDVTKGIKKGGAVLINTERSSEELIPELNGFDGRIYTINAREICDRTLGRYYPNTPMLAAVVKITGVMDPYRFLDEMKNSLRHKFAKKPEVLDGNMQALRLALEAVRGNGKIGYFHN